MVQKADHPKTEGKKRKFEKESKGRAKQPSEKRQEAVQAYAVTTTPAGTTTGGIPMCNHCRYHHTSACWI